MQTRLRALLEPATIELDHAKRDSRLVAYGGVVLQRFFKGLYGNATILLETCWKPTYAFAVLYFFVCLFFQLLRPI